MAASPGAPDGSGSKRTFLDVLSDELGALSAMLSRYAQEEKRRREARARERITPAQLQALLAARYARPQPMGMDLANAGWSLLLELFLALLEQRRVRLARLAADARVPVTTAMRWIDQFIAAGLVHRETDPERPGTVFFGLTEAGAEAMEDYFVSIQLGWAEADPPE